MTFSRDCNITPTRGLSQICERDDGRRSRGDNARWRAGRPLKNVTRTIRHYDEVGLTKLSGRTEGGFRRYTKRDFTRLLLIRRMKRLGFMPEAKSEPLRVIDHLETSELGEGDADVPSELKGSI